jgi:hypothetical protein
VDFDKYKGRLKQYLDYKGHDTSINPMHCFNTAAHVHGDANPSCQIKDDGFRCFGCGVQGDIYDAVEILEGITDKAEQFKFIDKLFGNGDVYIPPPPPRGEKEKFKPDVDKMKILEEYWSKNPASEKMIKQFLSDRASHSTEGAVTAYPDDVLNYLVKKFYYWPGYELVVRDVGKETLAACGIPLINPRTQHSSWEHSGVLIKLGVGYKLHYYEKKYCDKCSEAKGCGKYKKSGFCWKCEKRNTNGGKTFPMPGTIDKTKPVVLVEGEMDALTCVGCGIENLFSAGGSEGLTGPKATTWLLDVPEIILCYDADEPGRKASGLDPLEPGDKRKTNIPQIIKRAGYTGKIKLAELPPATETGCKDQDALVLAGKRDVIIKAITDAKEYVPPPENEKEKKGRRPEPRSAGDLSSKRLKCLLRKLRKEDIKPEDVQPFITSCIKSFKGKNTVYYLQKWGASAQEISAKYDTPPSFILEVAEKYLSKYPWRQLKRELTSSDDYYKNIVIQGTPIELDFEEVEMNENARNFARFGGIRSAALLLADVFDNKIIYDAAKNEKQFFFYDGHIWKHEPDIEGVIYNALLRVLFHYLNLNDKSEADEEAKKKERSNIMGTLAHIEERRFRVEIKHEFSNLKDEGVYHNTDDPNDSLHFDGKAIRETITLQDGVMDFSGKAVVFRSSLPGEYRRAVLPYSVDDIKNTKFPDLFWDFMRGNFKNIETLETLMFYLSLIPSRVQYKYGAFWIGGKSTGKSTTIKILQAIFGYMIGTMDADVLVPKGRTFASGNGPTPYLARLQGLGASIVSETEEGATLNAGLWKRLTGDDTITARGLNEAPREFSNTAQIIISTNTLPRFDRHDNAVIERMIVIPFLVTHERNAKDTKKMEDLIEELRPEFPGVICLLAEYYIKLKNDLRGNIPISKESELHKLGYIAEVETDVDKFINDCVLFDPQSLVTTRSVYKAYMDYYELDENSAKRGEALSPLRFSKFIFNKYKDQVRPDIQRVDGKTARCFRGIILKSPEEIIGNSQAAQGNAVRDIWDRTKKTGPETEEDPF